MIANRRGQAGLVLLGVAVAGLGRLLAESPAIVEWHRTIFFPWLAPLLQSFSGSWISTAGEGGAVLLIFLMLGALVRQGTRAIGVLAVVIGVLVFAFYASWGLAYRYPSLSTRLHREGPDADAAAAGLVALGEAAGRLASRASASASFTGTDTEVLGRINRALSEGFGRLPESIEASPVHGVSFGPAKASRVSFALTRLQLSGYYFPWTGEAQFDSEMPRTLWPRVAAHEKAHQRGFARENEATVIGVLACLASADPAVFYSGTLGLFVSLDHELARADPEARRRIWATLSKGVLDDFRTEAAFWKRHEGVAGAVSERVNDTYLKAQGVRSGVLSYAETTRLLMQAAATKTLNLGRLLDSTSPTSTTK